MNPGALKYNTKGVIKMSKFHPLKVKEIRKETDDAVSVVFDVPTELKEAYQFKQGQYLTFKKEINGEEIRRNYSVCVSPPFLRRGKKNSAPSTTRG